MFLFSKNSDVQMSIFKLEIVFKSDCDSQNSLS